MKQINLLLVVGLLFSTPAFSESSSALEYLKQDPVSMFDLGCLRLSDDFKSKMKSLKWDDAIEDKGTSVAYDWENKHLILTFIIYVDGESKQDTLVKLSKNCIQRFKHMYDYWDSKDGKLAPSYSSRYTAPNSFFRHFDESQSSEPQSLYDEIDRSILFACIVKSHKSMKKIITCNSFLVKSEYTYSFGEK